MKELAIKGEGKIYMLSDKEGNVFYVGSTVLPMKVRLQCHITDAKYPEKSKANKKKADKIRSLNYEITATILEVVPVEFEGSAHYTQWTLRPVEAKWITKFRSEGHDLCNAIIVKKIKPYQSEKVGESIHYLNQSI